MRMQAWQGVLLAAALSSTAYADDCNCTDNTNADSTWASRAMAGYTKTGGNTDTSSANALFHIAHVIDDWKLMFGAEGLYGSTKGETTAQAWDAHLQANYNFTDKLYWYTAARYDDNKFSGFAYQEVLSTGAGYQFLTTDTTKLTAQIGVGVRKIRPEILTEDDIGAITSTTEEPATTGAVLDAAVHLDHSFNSYTKVIFGLAVESGAQNTMTDASIQLQVKMSKTLALSAGYEQIRNSTPPTGVGKESSLTTLSLVYEFKNPKFAPE
jgi:putative salt-induced outer membrane protein